MTKGYHWECRLNDRRIYAIMIFLFSFKTLKIIFLNKRTLGDFHSTKWMPWIGFLDCSCYLCLLNVSYLIQFMVRCSFCFLICFELIFHFIVCGVDKQISSKLINYRQIMMCNDNLKVPKSLCGLKSEFTSSYTYSNTVVLVHNQRWNIIKNIGDMLSACGISSLSADIAETNYDLSGFCSLTRTTLIFSVTNETNNFLDVSNKPVSN